MTSQENLAILFPLLGVLEDGEPFEYLLNSVNPKNAEISIPNWLTRRAHLNLQEKIELFIPQHLSIEYTLRENFPGVVITKEQDTYTIAFPKEIELRVFSLQESPIDLLIRLVKDILILKSGIRVYFKHLIPYFSRIVNYSEQDYVNLKKFFLNDILKKILENESQLQTLFKTLEEKLKKQEEIAIYLNLEDLRVCLESEIYLPMFNVAFSETKLGFLEQFQVQSQFAYSKYLIAIKQLEKRLYSNYNLIVMIYSQSL